LPRRSSGRRVPSNQASLPSAPAAATLPPSFRKSHGQRGGHRPGRGSRPRDDASLRPRALHDDRSTRPMWRWWNTEGVALPKHKGLRPWVAIVPWLTLSGVCTQNPDCECNGDVSPTTCWTHFSGRLVLQWPLSSNPRGRSFHSRVLDYARAGAVNVKANYDPSYWGKPMRWTRSLKRGSEWSFSKSVSTRRNDMGTCSA